ncbi:MAG TPA: 6-phosphofructokinase, partial [Candidatus Hydrogenedentes bacterium]|nr:6-phosphofructokinase [Candidatus Hydrogenedentota bacterium]
YFLTPLESVARKARSMPDEFINADGNGVTEAFIKYCRPLVGAMPVLERIAAPRAAKVRA